MPVNYSNATVLSTFVNILVINSPSELINLRIGLDRKLISLRIGLDREFVTQSFKICEIREFCTLLYAVRISQAGILSGPLFISFIQLSVFEV